MSDKDNKPAGTGRFVRNGAAIGAAAGLVAGFTATRLPENSTGSIGGAVSQRQVASTDSRDNRERENTPPPVVASDTPVAAEETPTVDVPSAVGTDAVPSSSRPRITISDPSFGQRAIDMAAQAVSSDVGMVSITTAGGAAAGAFAGAVVAARRRRKGTDGQQPSGNGAALA